MLERIRKVLVDTQIGALVIAILIAAALIGVASILRAPLDHAIVEHAQKSDPFLIGSTPRTFDWTLLLPLELQSAIELLMAALLLRWLYWPAGVAEVVEDVDESNSEAEREA